jgi:hypothetical protein
VRRCKPEHSTADLRVITRLIDEDERGGNDAKIQSLVFNRRGPNSKLRLLKPFWNASLRLLGDDWLTRMYESGRSV